MTNCSASQCHCTPPSLCLLKPQFWQHHITGPGVGTSQRPTYALQHPSSTRIRKTFKAREAWNESHWDAAGGPAFTPASNYYNTKPTDQTTKSTLTDQESSIPQDPPHERKAENCPPHGPQGVRDSTLTTVPDASTCNMLARQPYFMPLLSRTASHRAPRLRRSRGRHSPEDRTQLAPPASHTMNRQHSRLSDDLDCYTAPGTHPAKLLSSLCGTGKSCHLISMLQQLCRIF